MKKNTAAWARDLARKHLETPLPRRWAHTQGVARQARTLAPILGNNADLLEAAAWLHDIGYAPDLVSTGFHPLDGARYLRDATQADEVLCRLVAGHSCAIIEARERGLAGDLAHEFPQITGCLSRALIYCDMTTTPDGNPVVVSERLAEIRKRYGPSHTVTRFTHLAEPELVDAVRDIQKKTQVNALIDSTPTRM
ncbi:HD domain-containing protein [Actinomadura darangshiensis]|uniref:HD domain-containing protein n=1 Tax=Actinomadura darangshiensis TaxID=705336 RepID=A0A4R5ACI0_9ACTN|nr:HD domain-containing protein [Actinomadura darangshiensis]TDD69405.1 HD domain-containing protein [Actinomadura darangshiensis]